MGHSASIAKKYTPEDNNKHINDEGSIKDDDSLATIQSYRPTSPLAHLDAQQFSFRGSRGSRPPSRISLQGNGTIPNGSLYYHSNPTRPSSITSNQRPRSMRDVNHFLMKNPELLSKKQAKKMRNEFADIEGAQKQIKTKQNVYLGFFDPPTIYGKGVDPEKQLKVNQRVYLQLIHPTYHQQYFKPYRPLVPRDMMIVRKEDYMRKPPLERSRPPLKGMEVTRASPVSAMEVTRASPPAHYNQPTSSKYLHGSETNQRFSSRKSPHQDSHNSLPFLPSSTPLQKAPLRKNNDYVDIPNLKTKQHSTRGLSKLNADDLMEVERRFDSPSIKSKSRNPPQDEDIVFDYSVEELGLKKKTKASQHAHLLKEGDVEPLYFRKSLAYNPRYSSSGNVLSDPL